MKERTSSDPGEIAMTTIRTTLRRLLFETPDAPPAVHFHRRGAEPEPCFDARCSLPRL
jgi:hypothetical protein